MTTQVCIQRRSQRRPLEEWSSVARVGLVANGSASNWRRIRDTRPIDPSKIRTVARNQCVADERADRLEHNLVIAYAKALCGDASHIDLLIQRHHPELRRYAFLSGYAKRTDDEQAEMIRLREELEVLGIEHGWSEVEREAG